MRVQSRGLALVGLLAVAVVAVGLLQRQLTVPQAAGRIGLAVLVLVAVDRYVLPFVRLLVGAPQRATPPASRASEQPGS